MLKSPTTNYRRYDLPQAPERARDGTVRDAKTEQCWLDVDSSKPLTSPSWRVKDHLDRTREIRGYLFASPVVVKPIQERSCCYIESAWARKHHRRSAFAAVRTALRNELRSFGAEQRLGEVLQFAGLTSDSVNASGVRVAQVVKLQRLLVHADALYEDIKHVASGAQALELARLMRVNDVPEEVASQKLGALIAAKNELPVDCDLTNFFDVARNAQGNTTSPESKHRSSHVSGDATELAFETLSVAGLPIVDQ